MGRFLQHTLSQSGLGFGLTFWSLIPEAALSSPGVGCFTVQERMRFYSLILKKNLVVSFFAVYANSFVSHPCSGYFLS